MNDDIDKILNEQARYYEERAPEYDDVWFRRGRYDLGPEGNVRWFQETAALEAAVDEFAATGDVLELACGTGLFTRHLVPHARTLTAVDGAAAVLEINRSRVADPKVQYVCADLFAWEPPEGRRYDEIVFAFFLSHVPPSSFERFWKHLDSWLAPGGRIFFCDDLAGAEERPSNPGESVEDGPDFVHHRRLTDGRLFTIVKIFYTPEELTSALAGLGWSADIRTTGDEFLYATVTRQPS